MNPGSSVTARFEGLDALRGIAAVLVMLFHFTTQYDRLFGHVTAPLASIYWGHYGVNLFFMISGFVIFLTLHRVRHPLDFLVSRFSRLFPAFWVAVIASFVLTLAFDLPGKVVSLGTAMLNLFMFHGMARIPHVDGVYWTLEVELIFYGLAFMLYLLGRLDKVHNALAILLGLRLTYFLADHFAGVEFSYTLSRFLILPFIAWFTCGIMIYRRIAFPAESPRRDGFLLAAAILQVAIVDGPGIGILAAALSGIFWATVTGKLPFLANPLLVWLGAISYTLYLLHENIGWGAIMYSQQLGIPTNLSILIAIGLVLALATALTGLVERPAMAWLRERYRKHSVTPRTVHRVTALVVAGVAIFGGLAYFWHHTGTADTAYRDLLAGIFRPSLLRAIPCQPPAALRPAVVLVLGQSNAGNHGSPLLDPAEHTNATFFFEGRCYPADGLAPGATGRGGNIWTAMSPMLSRALGRPVVFSVLAVESTEVRNWVEAGALRRRLIETLADLRQHSLVPDVVLWQQGEADGRAGTSSHEYQERFTQMVTMLRAEGIHAPVLVARSTRCRNNGSNNVRAALIAAAAADPSVVIGPDTDVLQGSQRSDGCHFSASGLNSAAVLWLGAIVPLIQPQATSSPSPSGSVGALDERRTPLL